MRTGLKVWTAALLLALVPLVAGADVVAPSGYDLVDGNSNNSYPWGGYTNGRYQQVYASTEFSGPEQITELRVRPDTTSGGSYTRTWTSAVVTLSTTSAAPDALSTTFASNVGADVTTVYSGALTLSSANTGAGPRDFDVILTFTTPFDYDPADGNLLLDVALTGGTGTSTFMDAVSVSTDGVSRLYSTSSATATSGSTDSGGVVTYFVTDLPPLQLTCPVDQSVECGTTLALLFGVYEENGEAVDLEFFVDDTSEDTQSIASGTAPTDTSATFSYVYEGVGDHLVRCDAINDSGDTASCELTVTVVDTTAPVLSLVGDATVTLECGSTAALAWTDPGAEAEDCGDPDVEIDVDGDTVNPSSCGEYVITYDATDASDNVATQISRTVIVEDTVAPAILLTGDNPLTVECADEYVELGATATDDCDANVQDSLDIDASDVDMDSCGTYTVSYTATDECGENETTVTRTVIVDDTTPPEIALIGANPLTVECGTEYVDPGATATDACDANIQDSLEIDTSGLDMTECGEYVVSYTATDECGENSTTVTRTVIVDDTIAPEVTVRASRSLLWPPRWGMFPVGMSYLVEDACDEAPFVRIKVYSDEAGGSAPYDTDATMDAAGMRLRAERAFPGDGRVYLIVVEATDECGENTGYGCVSVVVPAAPTFSWLTNVRTQATTAEAVVKAPGYGGTAPSGFVLLYDSGAAPLQPQ